MNDIRIFENVEFGKIRTAGTRRRTAFLLGGCVQDTGNK